MTVFSGKAIILLLLSVFRASAAPSCSGENIRLRGAGSANSAEFIDYAIRRYKLKRSHLGFNVDIEYRGVSSSYGRMRVVDPDDPLHFAISDSSMNETLRAGFYETVIAGSGIRIIYYMPEVQALQLSVTQLAWIFSGKITRWSDPALASGGRSKSLPDHPIAVIPRADISGTTLHLTMGLSLANEDWAREFGMFDDPDFASGHCCKDSRSWKSIPSLYGLRSYGMLGVVSSIPRSIGYVAVDVSDQKDIQVVTVVNSQGVATRASPKFVRNAMDKFFVKESNRSTSRSLFPNAYPFLILYHAILNIENASCCEVMELVGFMIEMKDLAQREVDRFAAVVLTSDLKAVLVEILGQIRCDGRNMLEAYFESQKRSSSTTAVIISCAAVVIAAAAATVIAAVTRYRHGRSIAIGEWLINPQDISTHVKPDESRSFTPSVAPLLMGLSNPEDARPKAPGMVGYGTYGAMQLKVDVVATALPNPSTFRRTTHEALLTLKHNTLSSHLQKFIGITTTGGLTSFIYERSTRGSIHSVLQRTRYTLSDQLRYSFVLDAVKGVRFLHDHNIIHGHISSLNLFFADNWTIKIGRWAEMLVSQSQQLAMEHISSVDITDLSEENILRLVYCEGRVIDGVVDQYSDVFSTAVLALEVLGNQVPYVGNDSSQGELSKHLAEKFTARKVGEYPDFAGIDPAFRTVITRFLNPAENYLTIKSLHREIEELNASSAGIVEIMLETMEGYVANLEEKVTKRTVELSRASDRMKELVYAVLPMQIANKLINSEMVQPEYFESATLYFSDIVGFTTISSKSTPNEVMAFLNDMWLKYDSVVTDFDCYKVDTIGDAYLVCSGLPVRNGKRHVKEIVALAKALREATRNFKIRHLPREQPRVRIGVHSGPVTAGIVGAKLPQYCLFGETVNTAMVMEATSEPMKIHISATANELLQKFYSDDFKITLRGENVVNGKATLTYWAD